MYPDFSGKQDVLHRMLTNKETAPERIKRLTGFDRYQCPFCKTGIMNTIELLPRIRSPDNVLYKTARLSV